MLHFNLLQWPVDRKSGPNFHRMNLASFLCTFLYPERCFLSVSRKRIKFTFFGSLLDLLRILFVEGYVPGFTAPTKLPLCLPKSNDITPVEVDSIHRGMPIFIFFTNLSMQVTRWSSIHTITNLTESYKFCNYCREAFILFCLIPTLYQTLIPFLFL